MLQDIRYAFRTLLRARSFTASAVLTLGLGVAVNTLVFTLLDALALRPIPVRDPARVVRIFPVDSRGQRETPFLPRLRRLPVSGSIR
jgi:putative ABC transport system permease protein